MKPTNAMTAEEAKAKAEQARWDATTEGEAFYELCRRVRFRAAMGDRAVELSTVSGWEYLTASQRSSIMAEMVRLGYQPHADMIVW